MLNKLFKMFKNIIFLDIETTGLDPIKNEIIEMGAQRVTNYDGYEHVDFETNLLIRPSKVLSLPDIITKLTGITYEQLEKNGIDKERACVEMKKLLDVERPLIVAYNAQFDLSFLYYYLNEYKMTGILKNARFLDALTIYRDRRDYPHRLEHAVDAYKLNISNTHRALDDAQTTFELLKAMEEECDDLDRYINLFGYISRYGVSGMHIASVKYVPQSFIRDKKAYD